MYEVEGGCEVEVTTNNKFEVEGGCATELTVNTSFEVNSYLKRWTICNDDVYLLKFHEAPPGWLEDIINGIIDETNLADDVSDLEDRFANFEEGYTVHFYDWRDGDTDTLAYVETIYTTNAVFNAGLQEIKVAYVSKDESGAYFDSLIAAWQTGQGGAWFNERVSVVSNVAYAAAKSASTLTATMGSQQDAINAIIGDIDVLEKQVDGKVVTWFVASTNIGDGKPFDIVGPVNPDGTVNENAKPYFCWLPGNICPEDIYNDDTTADTRAEHTGDTYVYFEYDVNGNKHILSTWRFGKDPYSDVYNWFIFTDDIATQAYQAAIDAQVTADSKIVTFYQGTPPNQVSDPDLGAGDIWVDSSHENRMYRYDGTQWILVRDTDITASVTRLDEATVDVDGVATAKSSLVVNADGNISGVRLSATNDPNNPGSEFRIFADNFYLANSSGQAANTVPFSVDTNARNIKFNGYVEFSNILDNGQAPDWVFKSTLEADIDRDVTTINGGKITTGYVDAKYLGVDTVWSRGMIVSADYSGSLSGYIGAANPTGFMINATAGAGSYNEPNIYGSYIRGGSMYATHLTAVRIDAAEIYAAEIYAGYIEAGILVTPSINGMKFKMGTFVTTHDYDYDVNIDVEEGIIRNSSGTIVHRGDRTAPFQGLVSVIISAMGPSTVPTTSPAAAILSHNTFRWDRSDTYSGTQYFSFVAWGY